MVRKLKVYQTSIGFFDLLIAAPSMKAALEAWGANTNLFHHGVAKEVADPAIVAAALARPGIVLQRPVGSSKAFKEHAELPTNLVDKAPPALRTKSKTRRQNDRKPKKAIATHDKADRERALAYQREEKRRQREQQREEAAEVRKRERREKALAGARAALDKAEREHARRADSIAQERAAIDERAQAEEERWRKQKGKLEEVLRKARGV